MEELQNNLLEIERGFWNAAGGDGSYYENNFADNGLMILPFEGGILDKDSTVATVKQSGAWDDFTIKNPQLLNISDEKICLVYEAVGMRNGQSDYNALISSLYVKDNGWSLLLHQQTAI